MSLKLLFFAFKYNFSNMNNNPLNRVKVVLVEKQRTSKWLAEQLGVTPATVSKWCTNTSQPDLQTLARIAELLGCEKRELITE
jgi:DNA-binding Xre family transcriptional regulator